ncbi:MAG: hypothetical protein U0Q15_08380 [Kineosporiaceae bacterium]
MPKSLAEIREHADELAAAFESFQPSPDTELDADTYNALRAAVLARADAEQAVADGVAAARRAGFTWALIGGLIGTSGEAARQRYGRPDAASQPSKRRRAAAPR